MHLYRSTYVPSDPDVTAKTTIIPGIGMHKDRGEISGWIQQEIKKGATCHRPGTETHQSGRNRKRQPSMSFLALFERRFVCNSSKHVHFTLLLPRCGPPLFPEIWPKSLVFPIIFESENENVHIHMRFTILFAKKALNCDDVGVFPVFGRVFVVKTHRKRGAGNREPLSMY